MREDRFPGPGRAWALCCLHRALRLPPPAEDAGGPEEEAFYAGAGITWRDARRQVLDRAHGPVRWIAPLAFSLRGVIKRVPGLGRLALQVKERYLDRGEWPEDVEPPAETPGQETPPILPAPTWETQARPRWDPEEESRRPVSGEGAQAPPGRREGDG